MLVRALVCLALVAFPASGQAVPHARGGGGTSDGLLAAPASAAQRVEIVRTTGGVPHILAEDLEAMGYGLGWVMMEDHGTEVPRAVLRSSGLWGLAVGADSMDGDFAGRLAFEYAAETFHRLPADVRSVYEGFAAALTDFGRVHAAELPDWAVRRYTPQEVAARDIRVWDAGAVDDFAALRTREDSAGSAGSSEAPGSLDSSASVASATDTGDVGDGRWVSRPSVGAPADLLATWMAWARRAGEGDPEVGSNAWAFGPGKTASGNTILLRNPHLSWTAGYYEAHVRVPGVVDFYGDFRVGGPFTTIGGFNRHLGWATTNNYPVLEAFYALLRDPEDPDRYIFDGGSVPVERRRVEVEYRRPDGTTGAEVRELPRTPLGPVIHETPDTLYIVRAHQLNQFRVGEQWLRMMQAEDFQGWDQAMRIRAKVSSNLTYADRDGVIHLVWNAALPALSHAPPEHPTLATRSEDVWGTLVPYDRLPQLTSPAGGYVQNANDPPWYTSLAAPLDPAVYPANMPEPALRFRSQRSLELIHGARNVTLEDVVRLKHDVRMALADRVKDDLVAAVRERHPDGAVHEAIEVVAEWDNRASADSRGSSVFELWANRWAETTPADAQFATPWSSAEPMTTPRGIGDRDAAVTAFEWAVREATDRWGRWDVTWGEVHRLRAGDLDLPVSGCASALGCFRVLGFRVDDDGRYRVYRGDGWVLAVEFGDVPRAVSVLAYGNSNDPAAPRYYDQAGMFAADQMKPVAFTTEQIRAAEVRRYRPVDAPPGTR